MRLYWKACKQCHQHLACMLPGISKHAPRCVTICIPGAQEMLQAGLIVAGYDSKEGGQVYALPLGGTLVKVPFSIGTDRPILLECGWESPFCSTPCNDFAASDWVQPVLWLQHGIGWFMRSITSPVSGNHGMHARLLRVVDAVCAGGSGSAYIYGFCDKNWRPGMSEAECQAFVVRCVGHALARDGSSGGCIRTVSITKDGVKRSFLANDQARPSMVDPVP